jgi:hypothetical protein
MAIAQLELPSVAVSTKDVVGLVVHGARDRAAPQPLQAGIPFPRGVLHDRASLVLADSTEWLFPVQTEVLARWSDDSVQWLLLDVAPSKITADRTEWKLRQNVVKAASFDNPESKLAALTTIVSQANGRIVIDTGAALFSLDAKQPTLLSQVSCAGQNLLSGEGLSLTLTDDRERICQPSIERMAFETRGPIRSTIRIEGKFAGRAPCRFVARLCFFAGSALVRVRLTVHNPRRARHPGGLWDLGDPGSILFRELALRLRPALAEPCEVTWTAEPGQQSNSATGSFEIYQDSSGGANWQSRNHVDRNGKVPCSFQGYRFRQSGQETKGLRANPVVALHSPSGTITAAIEDFWQQFPKGIEVERGELKLSLFPRQFQGLHELQGGEQKTHTIWLDFGPQAAQEDSSTLNWVHEPARLMAAPDWYESSAALPYLPESQRGPERRFENLLTAAISGDDSLQARREIIDEYGWRNHGDLYADHEAGHYKGPAPIISHYNNQYDVVLGTLLHYLRTGDQRWFEIAQPLARHVVDIDIYHTDDDKSAYSGGMFWHTDHYKDAATASHRSYSKSNQVAGRPYGGGPCNEHNYTTGLLHYYYLTGDPRGRDGALGLANWVLNMDDGRRTIIGLIDDGPTGTASTTTQTDYHGPGRGCGNSINALLDGWLLTREAKYLEKAEMLIRRAIHPHDDIAERDLLNVEMRWSYTVFLSVLARYLDVKAEANQLDPAYAYAQASLLHYAGWMVENEVPYFDRPEKLEFPTETWAAQELRKANAMRLAAAHADEPLRTRLMERGGELAERAWADLLRFERPGTTRALAILLIEGLKDANFRAGCERSAPRLDAGTFDFGLPEKFVPQRARVKRSMKSLRGLAVCALRLADPRRWRKWFKR